MAKKTDKSSAQAQQLETQERKARAKQVEDEYGEVRFTCAYELSDYLVSEMALLLGPENADRRMSIVSFLLCGLIIGDLWAFPGNPVSLAVAIVLVCLAVLSMSATTNLNKLKLRYLRKHGYDVQSMSDGELPRELYVTDGEVVTVVPGIRTEAWPLTDLRRVRSNSDFMLADFGQQRLALFPRRTLSLNNYNALGTLLRAHEPQPASKKRAARKNN